jgi:DNA polymerase
MPEKETIERAREDKRERKAPSTQAGEQVREEIEHVREGKHGVRNTKQAIVGPDGGLLDRALLDAGIDREDVYVTNAVKHFKFEERGKRRIHKKPGDSEIDACKPWLEAEAARIRPDAIVCLGATAARSVIGKHHQLLKERGRFIESALARFVMSTVHPSVILRVPDAVRRRTDYEAFVKDLAKVARAVRQQPSLRRLASP